MILLLAIFVAVLAVVIVELSTLEPRPEDPIALEGVRDSQRVFGGVRQFGDRLGSSDAEVSMQFFTDMQCVSCAEQFLSVVPPLVEQRVRAGRLQIFYRHYSFSRNTIQQGFLAAEAAGEQGYQWQYAFTFFASLDEAERLGIDLEFLRAIAISIPELDVEEWEAAYEAGLAEGSPMVESLIRQDEIARNLGLRAQPSAVISGPGGTEIVQDTPGLEEIEAAIESVAG